MRVPLFGSFLALCVFLVLGQVWILSRGLKSELLSVQERELRRELDLAPFLLQGPGSLLLDSAAISLSRRIGYPVTFLDSSGTVLAASSDLPFQRRGLEVPVSGSELGQALEGDVGFALRRGSGEIETRLFAATRITLEDRPLLLQIAAPLDAIQRAVGTRLWQSAGLLLPALLLALLLTWFLGRAVVRPLHTLSRRTKGLAAGNFSRRMPRTIRVAELDDLAGSFNRLAAEMEARYRSIEGERDEMQALIDCMGEAVIALTEDARVLRANRAAMDLLDFPEPATFAPVGTLVRQPALRDLLESAVLKPFSAREVVVGDHTLLVSARPVDGGGAVVSLLDVTEVRRLERVRRDFVANASHELKTPLTAMRGFAETLMEDDPPQDIRRDFLASIRSNTLRLQHLVEDLLDLSRFESGSWVAKRNPIQLRPVVEGIRRDFEERLEQRGMRLEQERDAWVLADDQGLEQVLKNLVDNAIRYSPEGGTITVIVLPRGEMVEVGVSDTGVGIPSTSLNRIFERFYRVDPARSRAEGGTGLGLAIVRHLVHAMGGEVWAESELGEGTTIAFTLPAADEEDL